MGCSGSKEAEPSGIIIAEGVEPQHAGLSSIPEYSSSVDDRGSAVTAGFVRQAQHLTLSDLPALYGPTQAPNA